MPVNASVIRWQAPTEEVDGSAITYPLDYVLGISSDPNDPQWDAPMAADGSHPLSVATFPGSLNPDGSYEQPVSTLSAFDRDGDYYVRLAAMRRGDPSQISAWSNQVLFQFDRPGNPVAPVLLDI